MPPDHRAAVAELVARINNQFVLGNFDLDMDDGEIQYCTSFLLEGDHVDAGLTEPWPVLKGGPCRAPLQKQWVSFGSVAKW